MKIALCFRFAQLFDFTSLRQGQFLANDGEKPKILKALSKPGWYIQNVATF